MANAVRDSSARDTGSPHGASRGAGRVWPAAFATAILGGISALLAFWPSAHAASTVLGGLSLPLGAFAQLHSTETNQRWLAIVGAIAGGLGASMGVANGGVP